MKRISSEENLKRIRFSTLHPLAVGWRIWDGITTLCQIFVTLTINMTILNRSFLITKMNESFRKQ